MAAFWSSSLSFSNSLAMEERSSSIASTPRERAVRLLFDLELKQKKEKKSNKLFRKRERKIYEDEKYKTCSLSRSIGDRRASYPTAGS